MMYRRDNRNKSLDDFVGMNNELLRKFMRFASRVLDDIGRRIVPDTQDDDLKSKNTYVAYEVNGFEFRNYPAKTITEIRYDGKTVLGEGKSLHSLVATEVACYEPGDWENELKKIMKMPDLAKYARFRHI